MGPTMSAEDADLQNHIHESPLGSAEVVLSCVTDVSSSAADDGLLDVAAAAAVRLLTIELVDLLAIDGTAHADALEALAAVLVDAHVFDDLSPADANRVAETVALEAIRGDWALAAVAAVVTDRAIATHLDRHSDLDDRMAVGLALHRTAAVLKNDES